MTIMSHHSYGGSLVGEVKMELKKDIYMNDAGECMETTGGLPNKLQKRIKVSNLSGGSKWICYFS